MNLNLTFLPSKVKIAILGDHFYPTHPLCAIARSFFIGYFWISCWSLKTSKGVTVSHFMCTSPEPLSLSHTHACSQTNKMWRSWVRFPLRNNFFLRNSHYIVTRYSLSRSGWLVNKYSHVSAFLNACLV